MDEDLFLTCFAAEHVHHGNARPKRERAEKAAMRSTLIFAFALAVTQSACVMVGGYSSDGGWYIWPGSFVSVLVVALVVFFLLRRRR
jgi:hypothetical protein